jgi:bacillithiol system protein YtxJ
MGIFDKVFKSQRDISKEEIEEVPWHALTATEQLEIIQAESREKVIVVFKHSTRCGISKMVLKSFERNFDLQQDKGIKMYFLDLLANRDISNLLAEKFEVRHESPQLIIIKNEKVVHHASHQSIEVDSLRNFL